MYISCETNALIQTNDKSIISCGKNVYLENPSYIKISYTDSPFTQLAIINNDKIIKGSDTINIDLVKDKLLCFFKPVYYYTPTIFCKKSTNGVEILVYGEDKLKIFIKTETDEKAFTVNLFESQVVADVFMLNGSPFLMINFKSNKKLKVFSLYPGITEVLYTNYDNFELTDRLTINQSLNDVLQHKVTTKYYCKNNVFIVDSKSTAKLVDDVYLLSDDKKAMAFYQEIFLNGNVKQFVTDDLFDKKDAIKKYLGEFLSVCPSPFDKNVIALLYKDDTTLCDFTMKFIKTDFDNGLIKNFSFI